MDLEFDDALAERWGEDAPFLTALLGALSVSFPPGERLFIDSVRHYLRDLDDPELIARVRAVRAMPRCRARRVRGAAACQRAARRARHGGRIVKRGTGFPSMSEIVIKLRGQTDKTMRVACDMSKTAASFSTVKRG